MKATPIRKRLEIYRQSTSRSATGAVKMDEWEHALTVWGRLIRLSDNDIIAGQAQGSQITARATIRHRTDISHTMRVQCGDQEYEIVGKPLADNKTGREYLTLMLKGVADDRKN